MFIVRFMLDVTDTNFNIVSCTFELSFKSLCEGQELFLDHLAVLMNAFRDRLV